jgi:hypothetical protein
MPEHLKDDEMLTVERELSQVLAIEPSADFAAKVRARIEQEPVRANGWRRWMWAPLAAAAIIVIVAVMITRKPAVLPDGSAGLQAGRTGADVRLSPPSAPPPAQIPTAPPTSFRRVYQTTRSVRAKEPEVLIDPSVARAVRRLAMGRPVLPEVPPEPSLDPVVIEPLRVPDVSEIGNVRPPADQGRR